MLRILAISLRVLIALIILGLSIGGYIYLLNTKPETPQRPAKRTYPVAEVDVLKAGDFQVVLKSQGIVRPRSRSQLTAEVSGKISAISDKFLDGAEFKNGVMLIELDSRDHQTAKKRAEAALTRVQTALQLAQAQTDKARDDWKRLGLAGEPNEIALRLPQLKEAQANIKAAEADLAEAVLNVERCTILAPYDGRVIEKMVDFGQFVSPGNSLGQIYSTEIFEVRLPLRDDQLAFLDLGADEKPGAFLKGERGPDDRWTAYIERTDATVDASTRQLFVIAAINAAQPGAPLLPSGSFVEAEISGRVLTDVFIIPRKAVRGGNSVLVVNEDKTVAVTTFETAYEGDPDFVVAKTGGKLKTGDRISITPLPFVKDGDLITIKGEGNPSGPGGDVAVGLGGGMKGKGKGGKDKGGPPAAAGSPKSRVDL
ncbi:MAG: multidrug efflux system membrane fusion protein [Verrucomicrobiales bacterium]|jgi:multidrug efflux system membrane fusion protein